MIPAWEMVNSNPAQFLRTGPEAVKGQSLPRRKKQLRLKSFELLTVKIMCVQTRARNDCIKRKELIVDCFY